MSGLGTLIPFLTPIAPWLEDPEVSEIMVNPDGAVFCEREGLVMRCAWQTSTGYVNFPPADLEAGVIRIAREMGRDVDLRNPLFEGRLGDGSRVAILLPPVSVGGITLVIRKFRFSDLTMVDLVSGGMMTPDEASALLDAVQRRETILICGETGAGKTTLLNALAAGIGVDERVIVIEEVNELKLPQRNTVYLETRRKNVLLAESDITAADLLKSALRLRPDRIIVGEVRGAEAFDLLQALNTGHAGSLATIHANTCNAALSRLRSCVAMAGVDLRPETFAEMIGDLINVVVHVKRAAARRVVDEILIVEGYDRTSDAYKVIPQ